MSAADGGERKRSPDTTTLPLSVSSAPPPKQTRNGGLFSHGANQARWIILLILVWYASASGAVILTKRLFSGPKQLASDDPRLWSAFLNLRPFPYGLTVTATNNLVAWAVTDMLVRSKGIPGADALRRRISVVIGVATAGEIGLSNVALTLLSLSYATILKGVAPLFVMCWGVALGLIRLRVTLVAAMALIACGMALTVVGEMDWKTFAVKMHQHARTIYNKNDTTSSANEGDETRQQALMIAGLLIQMLSGILSGFRWVITQMFIKGQDSQLEQGDAKCKGLLTLLRNCLGSSLSSTSLPSKQQQRTSTSAIQVIRCTAPLTVAALAPAIALFEVVGIAKWIMQSEQVVRDLTVLCATLGSIGVMVCALLWAEYELVAVTSSLTVSVGFVMKEVVVIAAGRTLFGDALALQTLSGFVLVQVGVVWYALDRRTDYLPIQRNGSGE